MNKDELRDRLLDILVKAAERGTGVALTRDEAEQALDNLISSDDHPGWDTVRNNDGARDKLRSVVGLLR